MKTKILLIICILALILPMASAKDFIIQNESNSSVNYFVVNGTTGDITASGTGFFRYKDSNRNIYKFNFPVNINLSPQYDLSGNAGLPFLFGGICYG